MIKKDNFVCLKTFSTSTRFAINPSRIGVLESAFPGCIEVHLLNYDHATQTTPSGGDGLVFSGKLPAIRCSQDVWCRYAMIAGFDEVFQIACQYDSVVVLRPMNMGLGIHSELYRHYAGKTGHRKARLRKKYANKARTCLDKMRQRIAALTGRLDRPTPATGPFLLREQTAGTAKMTETALQANTVNQARRLARKRINELRAQGWECGQESCFRGKIAYGFGGENESTVAWLCLKNGAQLRVAVKAGVPKTEK